MPLRVRALADERMFRCSNRADADHAARWLLARYGFGVAVLQRWVEKRLAIVCVLALVGATAGFVAALSMPRGCGSAVVAGELVHGMDCLHHIKYHGERVLLLTNRPDDSGQDVTDRDLQQSLGFILPRLPAVTQVFCTQRRGMDPTPVCQAVPRDPTRSASGSLATHADSELGYRLGFAALGALVLGGLAAILFAMTDATAKYAAELPD
jgi:hypothetical protein